MKRTALKQRYGNAKNIPESALIQEQKEEEKQGPQHAKHAVRNLLGNKIFRRNRLYFVQDCDGKRIDEGGKEQICHPQWVLRIHALCATHALYENAEWENDAISSAIL